MKRLITFKNSMIIALLLTSALFYGQSKYVETFNASDDMVVEVNTSYTNIIFKTWNKNKVEVEAFIDDESLSEAEKKEYFDAWKFNVLGNSKKVVITSNPHGDHGNYNYAYNFDEMEYNMEFLGPLLESIEMPEMPEMPEIPEMPEMSIILEAVGNINFDYEAFQENEEEYMKKFEAQMEENFGPEFEAKMEVWGEKFGKEWEVNAKEMEVHAKEMKIMAEKMSKEHEAASQNYHKFKKINKTIIIKMPKNTKTDVNVRHGELKMADAYNIKATLNYSPFTANNIDGGLTLINAAYAPVIVNNWKQGSINVNYVEECNIKNIHKINLQAISSDVLIDSIDKSAIISGSIGNLKINSISGSFSNIDIVLENTDAIIDLPETSYSFYYSGTRSDLDFPKTLQLSETKSNTKRILNGYNLTSDTDKNVSIRAMYSSVIVQ